MYNHSTPHNAFQSNHAFWSLVRFFTSPVAGGRIAANHAALCHPTTDFLGIPPDDLRVVAGTAPVFVYVAFIDCIGIALTIIDIWHRIVLETILLITPEVYRFGIG